MAQPIYDTPEAVQNAFYQAINDFDLDLMASVWSSSDLATWCIHPGGGLITGHKAILESWKLLFSSGSRLQAAIQSAGMTSSDSVTVFCVQQHLSLTEDDRLIPPIIVTNVFHKEEDGSWRMIAHHASPTPDLDTLLNLDTPRVLH